MNNAIELGKSKFEFINHNSYDHDLLSIMKHIFSNHELINGQICQTSSDRLHLASQCSPRANPVLV